MQNERTNKFSRDRVAVIAASVLFLGGIVCVSLTNHSPDPTAAEPSIQFVDTHAATPEPLVIVDQAIVIENPPTPWRRPHPDAVGLSLIDFNYQPPPLNFKSRSE